MTLKEIEKIVANIIENTDYNHTGTIDYTEYLVCSINKEKLLTREKLEKAFKCFDLVEVTANERMETVTLPKKNGRSVSATTR